jgi:hypothetical protein
MRLLKRVYILVVGELQRFYSAQTSLQLPIVESELLNGKKN